MEGLFADFANMGHAAGGALLTIMEPSRLMYMAFGCALGLLFGMVPGIGGLTGIAMLLPFSYALDPVDGFAMLLGLSAVIATADSIPAILFGVPGTAASAATVLDGHPMAKRGESGRALSAAFTASLMGGIFGAVLLAISMPLLRPVLVHFGSPELLAFSVLGISMVAVLSGSSPLRGIAVGCLGILFSLVGLDSTTGTARWTFGSVYLWDGIHLVPLLLGLFALPELCDLLVARKSISDDVSKVDTHKGRLQGATDCVKNWWLVLRCSWIGSGLGAIPGIGGSVVDWVAYGHAIRSEKGARDTFGTGDVRGVIASESSNNAKEGGALIPTVAFGVPGSATMAILLSAFAVHGLVPGPEMLSTNLELTYTMVWTIALANIIGAGACFVFSAQFARLATLRFSLILPAGLTIIFVGAFESSRNIADIVCLIAFGVLGWILKRNRWPRAPMILGVVLGDSIERYLFISIGRYGADWLLRPIVLVVLAFTIYGIAKPWISQVRRQGGFSSAIKSYGSPRFRWADFLTLSILVVLAFMLAQAFGWPNAAKTAPLIVGGVAMLALAASFLNGVFATEETASGGTAIHMDISADSEHLTGRLILIRTLRFLGYLLGLLVWIKLIGFLPSILFFVCLFMRVEGKEKWLVVIAYSLICASIFYFVFDQAMQVPWPNTYIREIAPFLRVIPTV